VDALLIEFILCWPSSHSLKLRFPFLDQVRTTLTCVWKRILILCFFFETGCDYLIAFGTWYCSLWSIVVITYLTSKPRASSSVSCNMHDGESRWQTMPNGPKDAHVMPKVMKQRGGDLSSPDYWDPCGIVSMLFVLTCLTHLRNSTFSNPGSSMRL
jgi:hypothetical protein